VGTSSLITSKKRFINVEMNLLLIVLLIAAVVNASMKYDDANQCCVDAGSLSREKYKGISTTKNSILTVVDYDRNIKFVGNGDISVITNNTHMYVYGIKKPSMSKCYKINFPGDQNTEYINISDGCV